MRRITLLLALASGPAWAISHDSDTFLGWSKDGTWFAHQTVSGPNEVTELFFCATDKEVQPSWPKDLNEMERQDGRISCVRFADPNRAPYGWKTQLLPPKPTGAGPNGARVDKEFSFEGDRPGYVVEVGDKKTVCYVSGLRDDSKLGPIYWHPNGRWVGAFIDNVFTHCDIPIKGAAAAPAKGGDKVPDKGNGKKPKK
jgi:hypothetical protein